MKLTNVEAKNLIQYLQLQLDSGKQAEVFFDLDSLTATPVGSPVELVKNPKEVAGKLLSQDQNKTTSILGYLSDWADIDEKTGRKSYIEPHSGDMRKLVVDEYIDGKSVSAILNTYKISVGQLYSYLNSAGVPKRRNIKKDERVVRILEDPDLKANLIADYLQGESIEYLYGKYDLYKSGLYNILDEAGIERIRKLNEGGDVG